MPIKPEDELGTHVAQVLSANYELEDEVGRGGMGIVYCARDKRLKREIAIKVLPPELSFRADIRQRFLREAETAAQLNHPNIVPIYTVEEKDNLVYFVMAYIKGDNLGVRLQQHGPLAAVEVRRILKEVAEALAYAHNRNVIHRDIKPDNIIIDEETGRAMVTDFGIARALTDMGDSRLTATGMAIGTPAYMSPEQSAGDRAIDGRSDLYSLGVVGYQMLCGQTPFVASNTPSMLVKHLSERPVPVDERWPDIPPDLSRAVMMCLEKDPADRFPNAAAFAQALSGGSMPTLATRSTSAAPREQSRDAQTGQQTFRDYADQSGRDYATSRYGRSGSSAAGYQPSQPTPEELSKWNAPMVVSFRRKLAPYLAVNAILVPISLFSNHDFIALTVMWTVFLAFRYSKLWAAGYDWRDVFRQPRDRLIFDVAAETIDDARALFDEKKRAEVRRRARARGRRAIIAKSIACCSTCRRTTESRSRRLRRLPTLCSARSSSWRCHCRTWIATAVEKTPKRLRKRSRRWSRRQIRSTIAPVRNACGAWRCCAANGGRWSTSGARGKRHTKSSITAGSCSGRCVSSWCVSAPAV